MLAGVDRLVSYDLAALDTAAADIDAGVQVIETQLADLRAGLAPLHATWTGEAATAWAAHQARWDGAAADLAASLADLHALVRTAHANFAAVEAADARMWGG